MSFPAYPEYCKTDVEWLAAIPSAWTLSRLGFESWVRARLGWKGLKAEEYVDEGFAMLATPNIKNAKIDFVGANRITRARYEESPEIKLRQGDVLLAKDGSTLGTVNFVRKLEREATVNSSIAVVTPHERTNGAFLHYYFQADYVVANIAALKGGMGVPHLFQSDLIKFPLALPSLPEQEAIAAVLDRETAKIDALVEEQERLIALLKEKRQAAISHAVTKGLNPDAPMKDSGIEWLGQIPAHWGVSKLKFAAQFITSGSRGWGEYYADTGPLFIRITNLTRDTIHLDLHDEQRVSIPENVEGTRARLQTGDLLFSITAYLGSVAVVPDPIEEAYISQHVALCRLSAGAPISAWIGYVALSIIGRTHFELGAYGGTKVQLSLDDVAQMPIVVPPLAEQKSVLANLERHLVSLRELEVEAQSAITLLQERRAALISAAVTGKIDVRGVVKASNVVVLPTKANAAALPSSRAVVGAYAIRHLGQMGRMAVMKVGYLAQAHVRVHELAGTYERYAAGPYDSDLIDAMERGAENICGIMTEEPSSKGGAVKYKVSQTLHMPSDMLEAALGPDRTRAFLNLINQLKEFSREGVEAIATLYAVWNDLIAGGGDVTEDAICNGVFDWHSEKREKFSRDTLENWLGWMRRNGVVPDGSAPRTDHQGDLFA